MTDILGWLLPRPKQTEPRRLEGQPGPAKLSVGDPKVLRRDPSEGPPETKREIEPLPVDWVRPIPIVVPKVIHIREVPLEEWSTSRANVTDAEVQVAGAGHHRRKVRVRNAGQSAVFLGPERSGDLLRSQGVEVPPGDSIDFGHTESVYGVCLAGEATRCDVVQEFERHPDRQS